VAFRPFQQKPGIFGGHQLAGIPVYSAANQHYLSRPVHILWYPSMQPLHTAEDIANKNTCLRLGKKTRLFEKTLYLPRMNTTLYILSSLQNSLFLNEFF
jgi:hypothetical protein